VLICFRVFDADIIACLNADADRLTGNQKAQTDSLNRLKADAASIQSQITTIQGNIKAWTDGRPKAGAAGAVGAPAAGAPAAAGAPPAAPVAPEAAPAQVA